MKAQVIRLNREKHPNGDAVFIHKIDGHMVCGNIKDWEGKELAVHIPPNAVVDTDRQEFSWLKPFLNPATEGDTRFHKVTSRMIRKVESFGLMVEAPPGTNEGDDVTALLGVTSPAEADVK